MDRSNRLISFVMLASLVLMASILVQNYFFPPPELEQARQADNAAVSGQADPDSTAANQDQADTGNAQDATPSDSEQPGANRSELNRPDTDAQPGNGEQVEQLPPEKLLTLGSLVDDGTDRYLVTLNSRGATIRRVELNSRYSKGRLRYRDLEYEGGYLGNLDLIDHPVGCEVRVVGPNTPAEKAGIQVGDVIKSVTIDGKQFAVAAEDMPEQATPKQTKAANFEQIMAERTRPQSTIQLELVRMVANGDDAPNDGQPQFQSIRNVDVQLTEKPLELVRPEPQLLPDRPFDYPESFGLSLVVPDDSDNWPELDPNMMTANWESRQTSQDGREIVEFSYDVPSERLKVFDIAGPVRVIKRFWLNRIPSEQQLDMNLRNYDIGFEIQIENESDQPLKLAYRLDGPTGTPTEGWWYQIKTHGRTWAIGSIAGARDVIGSSAANPFIFYGGPEIVSNSSQLKSAPKTQLVFDPFNNDTRYQTVNFLGVDTQYFNVSLIPHGDDQRPYVCYSALPAVTGGDAAPIPEKDQRRQKLVDVTTHMWTKVDVAPGDSLSHTFDIFSGPKDPELLEVYGLEETRVFGWFSLFSKPLVWLLGVFYTLTFQITYAIPIVMLTMVVRSLMIPVSRKAALNAQMMQHLQPQMKEIADKYKEDMEKRAKAQRELFKKYNYNPFSGCLMGFIQLPIFIGLYRGLSVDIALRDQPLIPGLAWCTNLSAPDQFLRWDSWMPPFLADETGWLGPYLNILPLITIVLFLMQQKLFTPPATDDQQKFMQKMMTFMMIFMGFLFFKVPSGLCLYFITSSLWGIIERKMLPKPTLDTTRFDAGSAGGSTAVEEKQQIITDEAALKNRRKQKREREKKLKRDRDN